MWQFTEKLLQVTFLALLLATWKIRLLQSFSCWFFSDSDTSELDWLQCKYPLGQIAETLFQLSLEFTLNAAPYLWAVRGSGGCWQKRAWCADQICDQLFLFSDHVMDNHNHLPLSVVFSSGSLSRRASGPGWGTWPSAWPPLLSPGLHSSPGSPEETRTNGRKHSSFAENRVSSKCQLIYLQDTGTAACVTGTNLWSPYNSKNAAATTKTAEFLQKSLLW